MKKEVREGYKMTELGEIPSGWKVNKLKNILEVCYGKSQKEVENENGIYKILGTGGVIGYTNEYLWNKPSVLIGRKGTIDKPMYIEEPFWTVDTLFYTKINNENNVKWIYYYLNNIDLKKYNEATGVPSLSVNNLNNIKVITPSLREQEKIAEILSTVDEQIDNTEKLIQKNEDLKKGLMQQLLTKGIGHTEFKKTELGIIPKKWRLKKIDEIGKVITGNTPKTTEKDNYGDEFLWVSPFDMGNSKYIKNTNKMLSKKGFDKARKLPSGAVLVTCIGSTIGKIGIATNELSTNQQINSIICNEDVDSEFIYYAIDYNFSKYSNYISNQAVPIINKSTFGEFLIQIPELKEQNKVAKILSKVDDNIEKQLNKKKKLEILRNGLMQQLLTGNIRVI